MAEADADDRLSADQRRAFTRHLEHCERCEREVAAIRGLGDLMMRVPAPSVSDFYHRKQKQRLLARAGDGQARPERGSFSWRRIAVTVSLVVLGLGIGARYLGRWGEAPNGSGQTAASRAMPKASAAAGPRYEITSLEDASWTTDERAGTARVTLAGGSAAFHVHRLKPGQKFLVSLPDAEIEVRGTRFVVDVEGGRTRFVVVMEGKVALRHGGGDESVLVAGQRWDALTMPAKSAPPASKSATRFQRPTVAVDAAADGRSVRERGSHTAPSHGPQRVRKGAVVAAPSQPSGPPASAETTAERIGLPNASDLFVRGIHAFRSGRYDEADAAWSAFLTTHPNDPRAEDAAFLRAVGRARIGDERGAAALARAYLRRFPQGMRRKEAEAMVRRAPHDPMVSP